MLLEDMTEGYILPYTCHCCESEKHMRSSVPCFMCKRNAGADPRGETYKDWYKMKVEPTLSEQFFETETYYGPGCHPDEDAMFNNKNEQRSHKNCKHFLKSAKEIPCDMCINLTKWESNDGNFTTLEDAPAPAPTPKFDIVEKPKHYNLGEIECIDAIRSATTGLSGFEAYLTGNIIKYAWRQHWKNGAEDIKKLRFYADKLIAEVTK